MPDGRPSRTWTRTWPRCCSVVLKVIVPRFIDAAEILGLSLRHVRRLVTELRRHGLAALARGNRGRASPHRLLEPARRQVIHLARSRYAIRGQDIVASACARIAEFMQERSKVKQQMNEGGSQGSMESSAAN